MRHRLIRRGLTFAGLHLLAFGVAFAMASPMLNVEREPSPIAVASSRVILALGQPVLSAAGSLPVGEAPLLLANSLFWGFTAALTSRGASRLAASRRRARRRGTTSSGIMT